jgi:hypothetical protein
MNDNELDRLIDEALNIPLPPGLSGRLEQQIDLLAARERKRRARFLLWTAGAAAAMLALALLLPVEQRPIRPADTYTDPREAALAAEQALTFMSAQLNRGLAQVSTAGREFEKINQVLDKHLK